MNQHHDRAEASEHYEYDAVCEVCDEVNPQGTLLCKKCGNNLRDQQQRRFAMQGAPQIQNDALLAQPRRLLAGLLSVLGILIIGWTLYNLVNGNIDRWLIDAHMTAAAGTNAQAEEYWTGENAAIFDDMVRAIQRNPINAQQVSDAQIGQTGELRSGRCFVMMGEYGNQQVRGQAYMLLEEAGILFVAQIAPDIEIRGIATYELEVRGAGVLTQGRYFTANGYGQVQSDGSIAVFGQAGPDSLIYEALVYFVL